MSFRILCVMLLNLVLSNVEGQHNSHPFYKTANGPHQGQVKQKPSGPPLAHAMITHSVSDNQSIQKPINRRHVPNEQFEAGHSRFDEPGDNISGLHNIRAYKRVIDVEEYGGELIAGLVSHQIEGDAQYIVWENETAQTTMIIELSPQQIHAYIKEKDVQLIASATDAAPDDFTTRYRISENGRYEYLDGKPIVGAEEIKAKLQEGYKPITLATLYYEVKEMGMIPENISLKDFSSMTVEEQKRLLTSVGSKN